VNLPEPGTTARTYRPERLLASTAKTSVLEVQPASVTAFDECPDEMLVRPLRVNSARPSTRGSNGTLQINHSATRFRFGAKKV